ncbi:C-type lectin domain family 17, member A-like isoform X3 [Sceloporus undulatus]|uniref:C-type lectin domain family 17, member A-like isoform X3 n=1 Tax=Sceloporus undulatus TaxID=8520 RepID=UPI001C4B628A|nr:C-type lectin domain family 17, member A-like isoform X3 [Sceloporus undulatus]
MAYQRPGSEVSLANSERDYENVIPPHLLRWPQQIPEQTRTARPDVSILTTFTDNTRCSSRKIPIGFLYILACAALLIAISAFVLAFLKFIPRCPEGWPKFQTTCYYFSSNQHTWEEAQSVCFTLGAHLVVVHDNATEKFLNHQQNSSYWLGLRRYAKGHWLWVDDTPVQDTTESKGVNKTAEQSCMYVNRTNNASKKTKSSCMHTFNYICEKQQA